MIARLALLLKDCLELKEDRLSWPLFPSPEKIAFDLLGESQTAQPQWLPTSIDLSRIPECRIFRGNFLERLERLWKFGGRY